LRRAAEKGEKRVAAVDASLVNKTRELERHIVGIVIEPCAADGIVWKDSDEFIARHLRGRQPGFVSERQRPAFAELEFIAGKANRAVRRGGAELEIAVPEIHLGVGIATLDARPTHGRVRQSRKPIIPVGCRLVVLDAERRFQFSERGLPRGVDVEAGI
jgi:hypothetical protein